jgi:hypothetical protein
MPNRRPKLQMLTSSASPEEAAAVVAAIERFMRATAPAAAPHADAIDPWVRAALIEGVSAGSGRDLHHPWINT